MPLRYSLEEQLSGAWLHWVGMVSSWSADSGVAAVAAVAAALGPLEVVIERGTEEAAAADLEREVAAEIVGSPLGLLAELLALAVP